jgi:hypothetical protein
MSWGFPQVAQVTRLVWTSFRTARTGHGTGSLSQILYSYIQVFFLSLKFLKNGGNQRFGEFL